jgi:hypothetical protein
MLERREIAERAKRQKILDTALTFTAMMRVFSAGSKERIARKLEEITSSLDEITSAQITTGYKNASVSGFARKFALRKNRSGRPEKSSSQLNPHRSVRPQNCWT